MLEMYCIYLTDVLVQFPTKAGYMYLVESVKCHLL